MTDDQLESLFTETMEVFVKLLKPLRLSLEETEAFEERVFLWLDRFVRRPGNESQPVERFVIPLLSAASELARQTATSKGLELPSLATKKPIEIGIQLGLIEEVEIP
jgi:hypothetical protein